MYLSSDIKPEIRLEQINIMLAINIDFGILTADLSLNKKLLIKYPSNQDPITMRIQNLGELNGSISLELKYKVRAAVPQIAQISGGVSFKFLFILR